MSDFDPIQPARANRQVGEQPTLSPSPELQNKFNAHRKRTRLSRHVLRRWLLLSRTRGDCPAIHAGDTVGMTSFATGAVGSTFRLDLSLNGGFHMDFALVSHDIILIIRLDAE